MRPDDRDAAYLWDMLDAAQTVQKFMAGVRHHDYAGDRKLRLAVERCVEIIGEAARNVSEEFKQQHPQVPWKGMVAQRTVLAHDYREIREERMWVVATERVPELIALLEPLIPPLPPGSEGE